MRMGVSLRKGGDFYDRQLTMNILRSSLCFLLLTVACSAECATAPRAATESKPEAQELANLRAFARLYGVLRFFHPSDEAAATDWNRYAVLGVSQVRAAESSAQLKAALEALVLPIAPTVRIRGVSEAARPVVLPAGDVLVSWQHRGPGFDIESAGTYQSRRIGRSGENAEDLFEERVDAGEVAEVRLGRDLLARVPLAVWSTGGHTLPVSDSTAIRAALERVHVSPNHPDARIADLIVAWSVLEQFYPYFDVTEVDWQTLLDRALLDGLDDTSADDHELTLKRLVAALEDGHGRVLLQNDERMSLPLHLSWAEGKLVILVAASPELIRGDVIEVIDGVPASELLDTEMALQSGSPQWKRVRALREVGNRAAGQPIVLRVARESGPVEVTVAAGEPPTWVYSQPSIAQLDGGVWYFDLTRTTPGEISENIERLAQAPGVIFDLRGYPNATHGILNHLLSRPEMARWMHVAHIVRPSLPGEPRPKPIWHDFGWELTPANPHIRGHVVFLTDGSAISYAESMLGYVEALGIDIVGSRTAGTNGRIRRVTLPTGLTVAFTGMRVTRHDGSRSHLVGILPTIPIEPTVAGIRDGRDEILDKAIEIVRAGLKN